MLPPRALGGMLAAAISCLAFAAAAQQQAPRDLGAAVDELVERSRAATEPRTELLVDGREVTVRVLRTAAVTHTWTPPQDWPAPRRPLPGHTVTRWEGAPNALLPLPGRGTLLADNRRLCLVNDSGMTSEVLALGVYSLLPSRDGTRILVGTRSADGPLILDAATLAVAEGPFPWLSDARVFWGEAPGSLLATYELIDFSASSRTRIFIRASTFDIATREERPVTGTSALAALGRIAPADLTWAHRRIDYQVDPLPAPILTFVNGETYRTAEPETPYADTAPCGDRLGNLLWIRTSKRGSDTGRLWGRNRGSGSVSVPLTDFPTYTVGISADGSRVAYCARDESSMKIMTVPTEELFAADAARGEADRLLLQCWERAKRAIQRDFEESALGSAIGTTPHGPVLRRVPTEEELLSAGDAMRRAFAEAFGIEVADGLAGLAALDWLFDQHDGLMPEDPAFVVGLAGVVARAAMAEGLGPLLLQTATSDLTTDFEDVWWTDGMTYSLLSPFAVARERISSSLRMAPELGRVAAIADRPVFLAENFAEDTRELAQSAMLGTAGINPRDYSLQQVLAALQAHPQDDAVALLAYRVAAEEGEWTAAVLAARRLALSNPDHPEAFLMLAEALAPLGLSAEAIRASAWATELAPSDAAVWVRHGNVLFDDSRFDEARAAYRTAEQAPNGSLYALEIEERRRIADELEGKAP
jgi:tetratricopeptide (TPR) repeat protein